MSSIQDFKLPPHNLEAEKALLSCVFLDNDSMFSIEGYKIQADDFYAKEHQLIFEGMQYLFNQRKTIDPVTVSDYLKKKDVLEQIGGIDYLYNLSVFLPTASGVGEYAKIVKEKSVLRQILKVSQKIIGEVYEEKPITDILDDIEKSIMQLTQYQMHDSLVHIRDILAGRYEDYYKIAENPEILKEKVTLSGYTKLDNISGGFKPGELIILAARPSMGKTSFALNVAENVAVQQKKTVAIFSLEMGKEQIVDRMISMASGIPVKQINSGNLGDEDFVKIGNSMEKLGGANIFIDDRGGATVQEIKSKLRKIKLENGGLDLVIIDYLQLMTGSRRFSNNRVQEISEISRGLKEMARELEVPVMALSQLSRAVENRPDKRPQLSDLRESGAIEQDADMVLMLYREEYYDPDTERKHIADLFVRKNRNGPVGEVPLYFENSIMKFSNLDENLLEDDI